MLKHRPLPERLHLYFFPHRHNGYRPHFYSLKSIITILVLIVLIEGAYIGGVAILTRTNFLASVLPGTIVALTNGDRATNNDGALTEDPVLDQAAQLKANDMVANGYFAHVSPTGKTPWYWLQQVGYDYGYAGENLAVNFTDSEEVENAWMHSPAHRANIVKPEYTKIGVATASGTYEGKPTVFVVQFFASPAAGAAVKTAAAPASPKPAALTPKPAVTPTPVAPTPVTEVAVATPTPAQQAAPTSTAVLGAQTEPPAATPAAPEPAPNWFTSLLASPNHVVQYTLFALLVLVGLITLIAVLVKVRIQHPSVAVGAFILAVAFSGALLLNSSIGGSVVVPSNQVGSAIVAVP